MPGTPITIFISYSRRDSNFVDQLEADLKASNFHTWVDRRDVEICQSWKKVLQDAIDRCDMVLVVLSPASVTSPYVQMEYKYALGIGKHVILLEYQTCSDVPIGLRGIQRVSFRTNTKRGMKNLLIALNRVEIEPPMKLKQTNDVEMATLHPTTAATSVVSRPESVSIGTDPETIYKSGAVAKERRNIELATALWQQILVRNPHFHNGRLVDESGKLLRRLHSNHIIYFRKHALLTQNARKWRQAAGFWQALMVEKPQYSKARHYLEQCLRTQGKKASASGEWEQAINMWEALLKLKPDDAQATQQLSLAKDNQCYAQYYKDAQQFIAEDALSPAQTQLRLLWRYAPYYGDPKGLSLKAGMTIHLRSPATLDKEEEEKLAKEQREREAREARERERRVREQQQKKAWEVRERERQAREQQQKEAWEAQQREQQAREQQQKKAWEARERERQAKEQQKKEAQEARLQAMKRTPAWFIQHDLRTSRFVVWCSLFFLLSGLGTAIDILTQSRILALSTIAITMLLAYIFGYHRAIQRLPERLRHRVNQNISYAQIREEGQGLIIVYLITLLAIIIISSLIALFFANSVSSLAYKSLQVGHFLWITRSWWLGRQVTVGLIIGATLSLITFSLILPKGLNVALGKALFWGTVWGFLCWLICALLAFIFDWGFGFGNGWNVSLLGLVVGVIGGTGLGSSFIICMKGKPIF
jgi:hypothetical protein